MRLYIILLLTLLTLQLQACPFSCASSNGKATVSISCPAQCAHSTAGNAANCQMQQCPYQHSAKAEVHTMQAGLKLPDDISWSGWLSIVFRIGLGLLAFFVLYAYISKRRNRISRRLNARWIKVMKTQHRHSDQLPNSRTA